MTRAARTIAFTLYRGHLEDQTKLHLEFWSRLLFGNGPVLFESVFASVLGADPERANRRGAKRLGRNTFECWTLHRNSDSLGRWGATKNGNKGRSRLVLGCSAHLAAPPGASIGPPGDGRTALQIVGQQLPTLQQQLSPKRTLSGGWHSVNEAGYQDLPIAIPAGSP